MANPTHEKKFESDEALKLPKPFLLRRFHSLMGIWLVVYLCEHLLVNAQAAFFFQDEGYGFVTAVNKLEALPYLRAIEILVLGIPFLFHGISGMYYAWTAKGNAHPTDGSAPALPHYKRNRAYSWERITAWILVFGIVAHVIQMRFIEYPHHTEHEGRQYYSVKLVDDKGLKGVAEKLNVALYPQGNSEVIATSETPGGVIFLVLRETFKNIWMVVLYSLFTVAASYHAFNGLWTCMITWGVTLSRRSQNRMRGVTHFLMGVVIFLGLFCVWGLFFTQGRVI